MAIKLKNYTGFMLSVIGLWGAMNPAAATELEASLTLGTQQLAVFRKEAPKEYAHTGFIGASIGAYRPVSQQSFWGAVVEFSEPIGRDSQIGSGRIWAVRPVNFLHYWTPSIGTEIYMGAAQYGWIQKASGYYGGLNVRYAANANSKFVIILDTKYFGDLAHDGGPGGDQIVSGPSLGLGVVYRFHHSN